ncbi:MAG TPA: NADH-quinone oxidoreductase subunit M, partial [Acidimicrobiales bacterium]
MGHILPFLTILILLPAAGALVLGLLGLDRRLHREVSYALALLVSLGTLVFSVVSLVAMRVHDGGYQLVSNHDYTGNTLGVHWYLGVDGISIFLVLMTAVLFPLVIILGRNRQNSRAYFAWILLLEAAVMGSFLSLDLLVFFFMFELTLVPAYFIIAGWGHQRRAYAAIKFFLYTFLGSAFLLVGILALAFIHLSQYHYLTFSLGPLMQTHLSSSTEILLFLAFTAAFAVKAPLFPLHTWSPDAYAEAPEEGSVVLAGVLAKLGTYGIIRFDLNLFPHATRTLAPLVLTLAVIGILYGAAVARHARHVPAPVPGRPGEPEPRNRRNDQVKRVP